MTEEEARGRIKLLTDELSRMFGGEYGWNDLDVQPCVREVLEWLEGMVK